MKFAALLPRSFLPRSARSRILLWACLVSVVFGAIELGLPLEEFLRSHRNQLHPRPASGEVVLVGIDDRSLREIGRYPWPRRQLADVALKLDKLGARRIFFDILITDRTERSDDAAFADAMSALGGKAVLPVAFGADASGAQIELKPLPEFTKGVHLAHTMTKATPFGTVRRLPFEQRFRNSEYPSLAGLLGGVPRTDRADFPIDYSVEIGSIPRISAADVVSGKVAASAIAGKDVIIGKTFRPYSESFFEPVHGDLPATYAHILGAETLKRGMPVDLAWPAPFIMALLLALACLRINRLAFSVGAIVGGIAVLLIFPALLEAHHIFVDVMPAVFLLLFVGVGFSWSAIRQMYRDWSNTNAVSGLPNLNALRNQVTLDVGRALVAARAHNYPAIVSTLSPEGEKALVQQMAQRLMVGASEPMLYQGDEGIFSWFAGPGGDESTGAHLDALATLFRTPIVVEGKPFDLIITFGFDADESRLIPNRLASALVAADEAYEEGLKWKEHDPSKQEDSAWKLSLLSQLDAAIDAGDLWVAYQPKLDIATNRIVGAEALARWTHMEKGPISPLEFILAAEQSDRIEKLTNHVLEQAIRSAAEINRDGVEFDISVNLSARLIDDRTLAKRIRTLLDKHGLKPELLTLEVTETAALGTGDKSLETLDELRAMGIYLSVDDYGTGMSTLDYLQRIPATEIKIDRSFVIGMQANHATKVMVNSTIQLAHSLGQKVVAEGVEDAETLSELKRMNCDLAQGYLIGRPMTFRALTARLNDNRGEAAA